MNVDPETLYSKHPRQVVDEIQEMSSKALNDYNSAQKAVEVCRVMSQSYIKKHVYFLVDNNWKIK